MAIANSENHNERAHGGLMQWSIIRVEEPSWNSLLYEVDVGEVWLMQMLEPRHSRRALEIDN